MDWSELANQPVSGVLGYDQEHWRNPASIAIIRPDDVLDGGHLQLVDSFRGVGGMFVTRGNSYDDFVTMRNFSGSPTEKFLMLVDGRKSATHGRNHYLGHRGSSVAILDRAEIIRGPGASIWGTNAVSGVINVTTKSAESTQGNSVRLAIESIGTFLGEFVHGGKIREGEFYRHGCEIRNTPRVNCYLVCQDGMMDMDERSDSVTTKILVMIWILASPEHTHPADLSMCWI